MTLDLKVTQYLFMSDIDQLWDRVAFMVDGELRQIDSPRNFKIRYGKNVVKVEYYDHNVLAMKEFSLTDLATYQEFNHILGSHKIETIHNGETTLEQIFIDVTGVGLNHD